MLCLWRGRGLPGGVVLGPLLTQGPGLHVAQCHHRGSTRRSRGRSQASTDISLVKYLSGSWSLPGVRRKEEEKPE